MKSYMCMYIQSVSEFNRSTEMGDRRDTVDEFFDNILVFENAQFLSYKQ